MHVIIASTNHAKVEAVTNAFTQLFPEHKIKSSPISVPSGVSEQPLSSDETKAGAHNRVQAAQKLVPDADFWVSLESGTDDSSPQYMVLFAWVVVKARDGRINEQKSVAWPLPPIFAEQIRAGKPMHFVRQVREGITMHAACQHCWATEYHQTIKAEGAISLLTNGAITRSSYCAQAVILALLPFKNPELYP